jgi:hypothetical protein
MGVAGGVGSMVRFATALVSGDTTWLRIYRPRYKYGLHRLSAISGRVEGCACLWRGRCMGGLWMGRFNIMHPTILFPVMTKRGVSTKHVENTEALIEAYGINVRYNLMRHSMEMTIPGLGHLQFLSEAYHPVRDWIFSKPWDGVDRLQEFMETIRLTHEDKAELSYVLVRKWLVGAVRAVMPDVAGAKPFTPQGVLTFQGPQGIGKTEWFK